MIFWVSTLQINQSCLNQSPNSTHSIENTLCQICRVRQFSRPLEGYTTFTLCWLNTASCSWYAWNSHRLEQTQAWNKTALLFLSSSPNSSNFCCQSFPFSYNRRGSYKDKSATKTSPPCCSSLSYLSPTPLSPFLLFLLLPAGTRYTVLRPGRLSCRTAISPHSVQSFSILSP